MQCSGPVMKFPWFWFQTKELSFQGGNWICLHCFRCSRNKCIKREDSNWAAHTSISFAFGSSSVRGCYLRACSYYPFRWHVSSVPGSAVTTVTWRKSSFFERSTSTCHPLNCKLFEYLHFLKWRSSTTVRNRYLRNTSFPN